MNFDVVALPIIWLMQTANMAELISLIFMSSSIMDFCVSIIPLRPILLPDGRILYNDGRQLAYLLKFKRFY